MTQSSPLSETSLTRLLAALREQHAGAPTVAPLITRVADPTFRREAPAALSQVVSDVRERRRSGDDTTPGGDARPAATDQRPAVVIPVNLSGLLGAAGRTTG